MSQVVAGHGGDAQPRFAARRRTYNAPGMVGVSAAY
jgi:hypothetical protein